MNKEKYNQIIDEVYGRFCKETFTKNSDLPIIFATDSVSMKDRFINKCKSDSKFSEKWGLKIEERELSLEERLELFINENNGSYPEDIEVMDDYDTPTKLITITYNNETIEVYE